MIYRLLSSVPKLIETAYCWSKVVDNLLKFFETIYEKVYPAPDKILIGNEADWTGGSKK